MFTAPELAAVWWLLFSRLRLSKGELASASRFRDLDVQILSLIHFITRHSLQLKVVEHGCLGWSLQ